MAAAMPGCMRRGAGSRSRCDWLSCSREEPIGLFRTVLLLPELLHVGISRHDELVIEVLFEVEIAPNKENFRTRAYRQKKVWVPSAGALANMDLT